MREILPTQPYYNLHVNKLLRNLPSTVDSTQMNIWQVRVITVVIT